MNTKTNPRSNGAQSADFSADRPSPQIGVADVAEDMMTLLELQLKLLRVDLKETTRAARIPLATLVVAIALLLGCFPVFLTGMAWLLVKYAQWSEAAAYLTAAGAGALAAAILAAGAGLALRSCTKALARSQSQAKRNFDWIKSAFRGRKRAY